MKRVFLTCLLCALVPVLRAEPRRQINVAMVQNVESYSTSRLSESIGNVAKAFGPRVDYMEEYKPDVWLGVSYTRLQGSGKDTLANAEFAELLVDYFWGDRVKMAEKGPFWNKLYLRAGGRAGFHRWWIHGKNNSQMTELRDAPFYYSFGWTFAPHVALGLGRAGSLEYTNRYHFSGAADMAPIQANYLSYVYTMEF